mgnify:CR=1 FL=1
MAIEERRFTIERSAQRLAEIYRRYPADHVVHRSIAQSEPELMRLAQSLEQE